VLAGDWQARYAAVMDDESGGDGDEYDERLLVAYARLSDG
jgi:hypothetical protein